MYLTLDEYTELGGTAILDDDNPDGILARVSREVDSLTHNRIVAVGFDKLTEFQQGIIKEVCAQMADFEYENDDIINSVLQSYSINGVTMNFGSSLNVAVIGGVAMRRSTYSLLTQTGLCYSGGLHR